MKKIFYLMVAFTGLSASAQVGIGLPTENIAASAQFEVASTTKGFLTPRMTQAQKNAIASPAVGLLVYQTDGTSGFYYYNGSSWNSVGANLTGYATTSALSTEVTRAQNAETMLNTAVNTNAVQSNLAIQNVTSTVNQEVARAQSAEATLTTSLNNKAPKASPSLTGVVTVGGASSTTSAVVEVTSTTQGFLPPRMTIAQKNAITSPVAGLVLWCTNCGTNGELQVYNGTTWTNVLGGAASALIIPTVTSVTGRIWMDRNLGASRVALSSTDTQAYGDYYQWGRPADGHQAQYRTNSSGITYTKSSTSVPTNSLFIIPTDDSNDWLITPDNTLWTGSNPANNPCPSGFRIPTTDEWAAEKATWSSSNAAGAFASPLKLTQAGMLTGWGSSGALFTAQGVFGQYQTQTALSNGSVEYFGIEPANSWFDTNYFKSMGMSCRCIKN